MCGLGTNRQAGPTLQSAAERCVSPFVLALLAEKICKKPSWALDRTEQCCGVSLPTLTKRFGNMGHQSPPAVNNQISDNGTAHPESVDVAEAVALMANLGEAAEDEV